ncbi:MAG: energy transducer TonB [Arcobacteraceae bacterium]|nr:energy transducer TonB [Arcobacteraceae bacterium]MDY0327244.1 energy transducer TonB [Arcobacteraceae bacterium]
MKNFFIAILISILVHIILFFSYKPSQTEEIKPPRLPKTTSVKYVKLSPSIEKKEITKEQIVQQSEYLTPPQPLPTPKKKTPKKAIEIPKPEPKKAPVEKEYIEVQKPSAGSILESALKKEEPRPIDELTQSYLDLYGKEFYSFSDETKEFLKDNLSDIGRITQRYLLYPSISIRTKQQGYNIVEFMLHPNGDISDLKLLQSSSYSALDNNSIHTIKVAYKDYPKPKESTKVRIYIYYKLY